MNYRIIAKLISACVITALHLTELPATFGDSLRIEPFKETYAAFEPVIVKVTVEFDEPVRTSFEDAREATRQRRRLSRRLDAELRSASETVCEAMLGGGGFHAEQDGATKLSATLVGVLGTKEREGNETTFTLWESPGRYTLVVVDRDNGLESNGLHITIEPPPRDALAASRLFAEGGLWIIPALHGIHHGGKIRPLLETLTREYSATVYGKYARLSLALLTAESIRTRKTTAEPDVLQYLSDELRESIDAFPPGHPLRSRALLDLARLQPAEAVSGNSEETISRLLSETDDGHTIRAARQWLGQLSRIREYKARTEAGETSP